jgi:methylamine dehydrogenase heavy chain
MPRLPLIALCAALIMAAPARAELQPEELTTVSLPEKLPPHWVWVNDVNFFNMADGRAYLIDGDAGRFVGMVSGGYSHASLGLDRRGDRFVVPSTFHSRGSRGDRTDVLTLYTTKTLAPGAEIVIPAKKFSGIPFIGNFTLTDDGRFALVYNFTPEQSVTVADLDAKALVGEFPTPGCGLIYPVGMRRFMMQCGDNSMQLASLDASGKVTLGGASKPLWSQTDLATERAVRIGDSRWMFFTFNSQVLVIDGAGDKPKLAEQWSLVGANPDGWRIGGLQPSAYHTGTDRLYVLMHQGGPDTRKDPGKEVWVFDSKTKQRVQRIVLDAPATSLAISQDAQPLLYTTQFGVPALGIYEAASGKKLHTVDQLGQTLSFIQPAPSGN